MELYTLDASFLKKDPIENFDTAIWTERYADTGDFVITGNSVASILPMNTLIRCTASDDVGLVETRSFESGVATIKGTFLTGFLKQRIIRSSYYWNVKNWSVTGSAGAIAGKIVDEMCCVGGLGVSASTPPIPGGTDEVITNLNVGATATGTTITRDIPFGVVYEEVKKICDEDGLGFWLRPANVTLSNYDLIFSTYRGRSLTSDQTTYPVVRFNSALDTLVNVKELQSVSGYKNVCYAYAPEGIDEGGWSIGEAYVDGAETKTNFERRTMMIFCDDITEEDVAAAGGGGVARLKAILDKRAADALVNNNYVRMLDGQIVPQEGNQYGVDYFLGDIIELKNSDDFVQKARITEYIRSQDSKGETAYPTLSVI